VQGVGLMMTIPQVGGGHQSHTPTNREKLSDGSNTTKPWPPLRNATPSEDSNLWPPTPLPTSVPIDIGVTIRPTPSTTMGGISACFSRGWTRTRVPSPGATWRSGGLMKISDMETRFALGKGGIFVPVHVSS
jgi:hypothetical protein